MGGGTLGATGYSQYPARVGGSVSFCLGVGVVGFVFGLVGRSGGVGFGLLSVVSSAFGFGGFVCVVLCVRSVGGFVFSRRV